MLFTNVYNVGQTPTFQRIFFNIFTLLLIFIFTSCKDDDGPTFILPDPPIQTFETSSYSLLNPGNYWVYQQYIISQSGSVSPSNNLDSTYVDGDSLIKNETFIKLNVEKYGNRTIVLLRDSADYLIDENGRKRLGLNNFGEILYSEDTDLFRTDFYMDGFRTLVTDLAIFENALKKEGQQNFHIPQQDPDCGRFVYEFWVKDIGMVREEEFFAGSCQRIRRDLIRFNVE